MIGLQISPTLQICERLFVDDVGILIPTSEICFQEVEACIFLYEKASSAKLNMHKSSILPIGFIDIPNWLQV